MAAVVTLVIDDQSDVSVGKSSDSIQIDGTWIVPTTSIAALSLVAAAQALADRLAAREISETEQRALAGDR